MPSELTAFLAEPLVWRYDFLLDSGFQPLCNRNSPGLNSELVLRFCPSWLRSCSVCEYSFGTLFWFWSQTLSTEAGCEVFSSLLPQQELFHWNCQLSHRHQRINAFELWCWRRLLRVPWTARRSNQLVLKEISPEYSLGGLMLKLKLQYLATWCEEPTHWQRPWCWERLRAKGEGSDRGWED